MDTGITMEVKRLRLTELQAERRYDEASSSQSDLDTVQKAAIEWRKAAHALALYVAKHTHPDR
jgi:hypothetical protein